MNNYLLFFTVICLTTLFIILLIHFDLFKAIRQSRILIVSARFTSLIDFIIYVRYVFKHQCLETTTQFCISAGPVVILASMQKESSILIRLELLKWWKYDFFCS